MEQRRGHGYLYGTMVLAVGTVIVKLIGVFFKIPLTNILGGVGMSYFNVAYELYYPLFQAYRWPFPSWSAKASPRDARATRKNCYACL